MRGLDALVEERVDVGYDVVDGWRERVVRRGSGQRLSCALLREASGRGIGRDVPILGRRREVDARAVDVREAVRRVAQPVGGKR